MADNNRRNRPSSGYGSNDNFNWEEYDMKTSSASGAPRRRRQAASTKPTRSPQASSSSYREVPSRRRTQTTSRSKKKQKKQLTPKQIQFRKRLRLTFFVRFLW